MSIGNFDQVSTQLARMTPQQRQQYAAMHKDDPILLSLAKFINDTEQEKAQAMQPPPQGTPPKVVDQTIAGMAPQQAPPQPMPEQTGIGALPQPEMRRMAAGGITGYDDTGYSEGGYPDQQYTYANGGQVAFAKGGSTDAYRAYARRRAQEMGVDPALADAIFTIESGYDPEAVSPTGPVGVGQLTRSTGAAFGVRPGDRTDAKKNIDASLAFMKELSGKYDGDPQKIAVAYNQGEPVLNAHLRQNGGKLDPATLGKPEAVNYLKKLGALLPMGSAYAGQLPSPKVDPNDLPGQIPGMRPEFTPDNLVRPPATGNQQVVGMGEAGLRALTGLAALPVGGAAGIIHKLAGRPGSPDDAAAAVRDSLTYDPRTEEGWNKSDDLNRAVADTKLPPFLPGIPASLGRGGKRAAPALMKAADEAAAKVENIRLAPPAKSLAAARTTPKQMLNMQLTDRLAAENAALRAGNAGRGIANEQAALSGLGRLSNTATGLAAANTAGLPGEAGAAPRTAAGAKAAGVMGHTPNDMEEQLKEQFWGKLNPPASAAAPAAPDTPESAAAPSAPSAALAKAGRDRSGDDMIALGGGMLSKGSRYFSRNLGHGLESLAKARGENERIDVADRAADTAAKNADTLSRRADAQEELWAAQARKADAYQSMDNRLKGAAQAFATDSRVKELLKAGEDPLVRLNPALKAQNKAEMERLRAQIFAEWGVQAPTTMDAPAAAAPLPPGVKVTQLK